MNITKIKSVKSIIIIFSVLFLYSNQGYSQNDDLYDKCDFYDAHYHITNYIQEGPDIKFHLKNIMGDKCGRTTLFGIPLQQMWSYMNSRDDAPTYYLETDAPLYYYSFTDAYIAMQYLSLTPEERDRFDPMITGFNPADMYAAAHIKRVLKTFPGVFTGIGEFTIHKEFVSSKISGEAASLFNPALDTILKFCGESGLIVILHNDIDKPFPKASTKSYVDEVTEVFRRHSDAAIIWAHVGLGRIVRPVTDQILVVKTMLDDPTLSHVYFDISWSEVAKYIVRNDSTAQGVADLLNTYPDRFLFGSDEVGSTDQAKYLTTYNMYKPLWEKLTPETREKILKGNYKRLFDNARTKVRKWESENVK
jgi:predicted TIM-barrel fold metal-dependent hydrolase